MGTSEAPAASRNAPVVKPALRLLCRRFFEHDVGRSAASLAYYLIFALFPLLIFLSNLLGLLQLDAAAVTQVLQRLLPEEVLELIDAYLNHVSRTSSPALLWFALVFSVWFPMRAVKGLMDDVRRAYRLEKPPRPLLYTLRQLGYTVVFLLVMSLTLLLSVLGRRVLGYAATLLPAASLPQWAPLLDVWQYVRFIPAGVLMYAALGILYAAALDERQPRGTLLPGIAAALALWMVVSVLFSFYVERFGNYSLIYGALGAVIALLMWLYLSAVILILGAEWNAALLEVRAAPLYRP